MKKYFILFNIILSLLFIFLTFSKTLAASIYSTKNTDPVYYKCNKDGLIQKYKGVGLKYDGDKLRQLKFGRKEATIQINASQTEAKWIQGNFDGWSRAIWGDYGYCDGITHNAGTRSAWGPKLSQYLYISNNRIKIDNEHRINTYTKGKNKNYRFKNLGFYCIAENKASRVVEENQDTLDNLKVKGKKVIGRVQIVDNKKNKNSKVSFTSYYKNNSFSKYNAGKGKVWKENEIVDAYYFGYLFANLNVTDSEIEFKYDRSKSFTKSGLFYSMTQYALWKSTKFEDFLTRITGGAAWEDIVRNDENSDLNNDGSGSNTTKASYRHLMRSAEEYQKFCDENDGECIKNKTKKGKVSGINEKYNNKDGKLFGPYIIQYSCKNGKTYYANKEQDGKNYIFGALESVKVYTDKSPKNEVKKTILNSNKEKIKLPVSGEPFYIWIDNGTFGKAKKIDLKASYKKLLCNADFVIITSDSGDQEWLVVATSGMRYKTKTISINSDYDEKDSSLLIEKKDEDTGKGIKAGFKIRYNGKKWLSGSGKEGEEIVYKNNMSEAQEYFTDKDGKLEFKELEAGTYSVYETSIQDGYLLEKQEGYDKKLNAVRCGKVEVNLEETEENLDNQANSNDDNSEEEENVDLEETDEGESGDDSDYLPPDADENYSEDPDLGDNDEEDSDDEDEDESTQYTTDTDVEEIDENAEITAHVESSLNHLIVYNSGPISISGYVWLDGKGGKSNVANGLYDSGVESKVSGVTVSLVNKKTGEIVKDRTTKKPQTKITDGNGAYKFENIYKSELKDYYVKFNYKSTQYGDYPIVGFNSEKASQIVANGSRAIDDNEGEANTYKYEGLDGEKKYGLSGNLFDKLFDKNNRELKGINLGLINRGKDTTDIQENLEYVTISFGGKTFIYKYGEAVSFTKIGSGPTVQYQSQNRPAAYTREFYPSEVVYNRENHNSLKVNVIYRIDVINTATHNKTRRSGCCSSNPGPPGETEKLLYIKTLRNRYDNDRYILNTDIRTIPQSIPSNICTEINKWEGSGGEAYLNGSTQLQEIPEYESRKKVATTYIQFKVTDKALNDILSSPNGLKEKKPTTAYVNGGNIYEAYWRYRKQNKIHDHYHPRKPTGYYDNRWNTDENSWPWQKDSINDMSDSAPYLYFRLGQDRSINGTVFKDNLTQDSKNRNEVLGNGTIDNGEKIVQNAKVELLDSSNNVVNIYNTEGIHKAETVTDKDGKYSFSGIIPGEYKIRYTYGDKTNGDNNTKIDGKDIKAKDYKSTIITDTTVKNAFPDKNKYWYREVAKDKSVAKDDLEHRKEINKVFESNNLIDTSNEKKVFNFKNQKDEQKDDIPDLQEFAYSPTFDIVIENMVETERKVKSNGKVNASYELDRENFGIIEQPEQRAEFKKIITNVKLTNANNNIVFDGNPESTKMKGVMDLQLDKKEKVGGSTYTRAEVKKDDLYGSTIEITYELSITNNSDVNYQNDTYYWYGVGDNEVILQPTMVIDYLDDTQTFVKNKSSSGITLGNTYYIDDGSNNGKKVQELKITDWDKIYTKKGPNKDKSTTKKKIVATRGLSETGQDMDMLNYAKIAEMKRFGDYAIQDIHANLYEQTKVIVTPPTGKNMKAIVVYSLVSIFVLTSVSVAIVVIKKKIL